MQRASLTAAFLTVAMLGAAQAQTIATATTDLNIRSGPGPEHPVIGLIKDRQRANVLGCIEGSLWCQVDFRGLRGWAYSQYMTLDSASRRVVVTDSVAARAPIIEYEASADVAVAPPPAPLTTYRAPAPAVTYTAPAPAVTYTAPAPRVTYTAPATTRIVETTGVASAPAAPAPVVGSLVAPGNTTLVTTSSLTPPPAVGTYIATNPGDPVYLSGDVTVGAALPQNVTLRNVPDYRYQYVYVNDYPVLVDPATRRIVYVFR